MLRLLSRRKAPAPLGAASVPSGALIAHDGVAAQLPRHGHSALPQVDATQPASANACALSTCIAGSRATILEVRCGHADACRLRALGLCEGAAVSVVNSRDCTLLEVRGSRFAVSSAIAAGILVMPVV